MSAYTESQLTDIHAAIDAKNADKPCEQKHPDANGGKWTPLAGAMSIEHGWLYRPKPEPELRPWRADEVPIGMSVRNKRHPDDVLVISAVIGGGVCIWKNGPFSLESIFHDYTLSDGSPCGTTQP